MCPQETESWWNDVKSPVRDIQVRSSGMCNHIGAYHLCLANSMITLYSFLIQNTHFGAEVY